MIFRPLLTVLVAIGVAGCTSSADLPAIALTPDTAIYRLGSGDQLKITVFGEERLTGNFAVSGNGTVSLPLIGPIPADGQTVPELRQAITARLSDGFINDPSVSVEVLNFRPFYILGEVNKPGQYPFVEGQTVYTAVATAGGFTYRANDRKVFIRHKDESDETAYRLDGATPVMPGDTIRIAERAF